MTTAFRCAADRLHGSAWLPAATRQRIAWFLGLRRVQRYLPRPLAPMRRPQIVAGRMAAFRLPGRNLRNQVRIAQSPSQDTPVADDRMLSKPSQAVGSRLPGQGLRVGNPVFSDSPWVRSGVTIRPQIKGVRTPNARLSENSHFVMTLPAFPATAAASGRSIGHTRPGNRSVSGSATQEVRTWKPSGRIAETAASSIRPPVARPYPGSAALPASGNSPVGIAEDYRTLSTEPDGRYGDTLNSTKAAAPDMTRNRVSTVHIDGAALGRWVVEHFARTLAKPASGMTGIDPRANAPRGRVAPF